MVQIRNNEQEQSTGSPNPVPVIWNGYQNNIINCFYNLQNPNSLTDVTLTCDDGQTLNAHKVVLWSSSSYFKSLLENNPSPESPTVIHLQDIPFNHLNLILEYIYTGEVNVPQAEISDFLNSAHLLQIKGLIEVEVQVV